MNDTTQIWAEYHKRLGRFIAGKVPENVAEDILQEVFIKIHKQLSSLRETPKVESWVYQITRNTVIDYYRSKKHLVDAPDWVKHIQFDEHESTRQALASCLEPMIEKLPDTYRNTIYLSEIEGKTHKEIAALEGISLSGSKSRVQRGRVLLKDMLNECCQIERNQKNELVSFENKDKDCKFC